MAKRIRPGQVRDAIVNFLRRRGDAAAVAEIQRAVEVQLGPTPSSSVRSSLRLHAGDLFERVARGMYRLRS